MPSLSMFQDFLIPTHYSILCCPACQVYLVYSWPQGLVLLRLWNWGQVPLQWSSRKHLHKNCMRDHITPCTTVFFLKNKSDDWKNHKCFHSEHFVKIAFHQFSLLHNYEITVGKLFSELAKVKEYFYTQCHYFMKFQLHKFLLAQTKQYLY